MTRVGPLLIHCVLAASAAASPQVSLVTDGGQFPLDSGVVRTLPAGPASINLKIDTTPAMRVRYRLEGHDPGWREPPGEVSVHVIFLDAGDNQIGQESFTNSGTSSGWNPVLSESTFIHRRESILVPAKARGLRLVFSSAGAPTAMGVFIIDDIRITRVSPGETSAVRRFEYQGAWAGADPLSIWMRSGLRPSMAVLLPVDRDGVSTRVLALIDDGAAVHADWQLQSPVEVQPGERLAVEWNEMFSVGDSRALALFGETYEALPPSSYRFFAGGLDVFGRSAGDESVVALTVPPPFWKRPWFLTLSALLVIVLGLVITRAILRWRLHRQLEKERRQRQLDQERLRIARDLHDDLGARITQLSLVCAMAESSADTAADRERFGEISGITRDLVSSMYETVWTVDPENDNLDSLVSFLCQLTENLCKAAETRCRIKVEDVPVNPALNSEIRHHTILAVKEAVHNAIKHSGALVIELGFRYQSPELHLTVSDNGKGFDPATGASGHGIENMERRMKAIGGSTTFAPASPGTQVSFVVPLG